MTERQLPEGITKTAKGYRVRAQIGSGATKLKDSKNFPPNTPIAEMVKWRNRTLERLRAQHPSAARGTLAADVVEYLRDADITEATRRRRAQQLAWWCSQSPRPNDPVLSPSEWAARRRAVADRHGRPLKGAPSPKGVLWVMGRLDGQWHARKIEPDLPVERRTIGEAPRTALDVPRLRKILAVAFKAPDSDPTKHANTSNHYRTALSHLFTHFNDGNEFATNPFERVSVRQGAGPTLAGQDARIVAEILKHVPLKYGRHSVLGQLRLAVLAWVHITPTQLMAVHPPKHFHDVPDATRADILTGAVTLTKAPRMKGRKNKRIPPPETIPCNPWGVEALRAFAAAPKAWGPFCIQSLNKVFQAACARCQAALAARGVFVDLSEMTLYHLKHSLASTASLASGGLVDRFGNMQMAPGVQRALDHANARTTLIYTQAAVDPLVRAVNRATTEYLERLFAVPLEAPPALKIVGGRDLP